MSDYEEGLGVARLLYQSWAWRAPPNRRYWLGITPRRGGVGRICCQEGFRWRQYWLFFQVDLRSWRKLQPWSTWCDLHIGPPALACKLTPLLWIFLPDMRTRVMQISPFICQQICTPPRLDQTRLKSACGAAPDDRDNRFQCTKVDTRSYFSEVEPRQVGHSVYRDKARSTAATSKVNKRQASTTAGANQWTSHSCISLQICLRIRWLREHGLQLNPYLCGSQNHVSGASPLCFHNSTRFSSGLTPPRHWQ